MSSPPALLTPEPPVLSEAPKVTETEVEVEEAGTLTLPVGAVESKTTEPLLE